MVLMTVFVRKQSLLKWGFLFVEILFFSLQRNEVLVGVEGKTIPSQLEFQVIANVSFPNTMISAIGGLDSSHRYIYAAAVDISGQGTLQKIDLSSMNVVAKCVLPDADPDGYGLISYDDDTLFIRFWQFPTDLISKVNLGTMQIVDTIDLSFGGPFFYYHSVVASPQLKSLFLISNNHTSPISEYAVSQLLVDSMQFVVHQEIERNLNAIFPIYNNPDNLPVGFATATIPTTNTSLLLLQIDFSSLATLTPIMLIPLNNQPPPPCALDINTIVYCMQNLNCSFVDLQHKTTKSLELSQLPYLQGQTLGWVACSNDYIYVSTDDFPNSPSYLLRIPRTPFSMATVESVPCSSHDESSPYGFIPVTENQYGHTRELILAFYGYMNAFLFKAGTTTKDSLALQKSISWKFGLQLNNTTIDDIY